MKSFLVCILIIFNILAFDLSTFCQENSIADFIKEGKYQKAIDIILMKGDLSNLSETDLENLGYCYIMTRDYNKAEDVYAKLVSAKKPSASNQNFYAEILLINGKYSLAKEYFIKYSNLNQSDKSVQTKIASCDSLLLWQNQKNRYLIYNFSNINTELDEMCAFSNNAELTFLSNRKNEKFAKDVLDFNILAQYIVYGFDLANYNKTKFVFTENLTANLHKPQISDNYWCSSFDYCKAKDIYAFALKPIQRNMQDISLGKSVIMFCTSENKTIDNLVPFSWKGMPENINISQPGFGKNGNRLYFSCDMPGGFGGMDLYYSDFANDVWSVPVNLGENINTPFDELSPVIYGDTILFYSSNGLAGYGNLDVYSSRMSGNSFEKPVNLKAPINSIGDDLYYRTGYGENSLLTSNRSSMGKGGYDIYIVNLPTVIVPKDSTETKPVATRELDIDNYHIPYILFDIDMSDIYKNYEQTLKALADTLKLYNDITVTIFGYTDNLGNLESNVELSEARAKAVADKLIGYGVPESQIVCKGMGISNIEKAENITQTVIIGTSKSNMNEKWYNDVLGNKHSISVIPNDKYYSYCVGNFENSEDAEKLLLELKKGYFSESYIGYVYFGKCLPKYSSAINRRVDLKLSKSGK